MKKNYLIVLFFLINYGKNYTMEQGCTGHLATAGHFATESTELLQNSNTIQFLKDLELRIVESINTDGCRLRKRGLNLEVIKRVAFKRTSILVAPSRKKIRHSK